MVKAQRCQRFIVERNNEKFSYRFSVQLTVLCVRFDRLLWLRMH